MLSIGICWLQLFNCLFADTKDRQHHVQLKLNMQHQCLLKTIKAHGGMSYKFPMKDISHKLLKWRVVYNHVATIWTEDVYHHHDGLVCSLPKYSIQTLTNTRRHQPQHPHHQFKISKPINNICKSVPAFRRHQTAQSTNNQTTKRVFIVTAMMKLAVSKFVCTMIGSWFLDHVNAGDQITLHDTSDGSQAPQPHPNCK